MPDYKKIFEDIIEMKFPDKRLKCSAILSKRTLTSLDIIILNDLLFGKKIANNQKFKSYDEATILTILKFQKKHNLSNVQLSKKFKISRNTISKWKIFFQKRIL
ncbi:hypothetical protein ACM46_11145 [Chryseobacterium angstadtii]|uniref:Transposase n=1 Tax=Chryseobacterium angstadtii TaxID=558151 RepID=A0A0J7L6U5_9FLAO|nr:hypothetical protein ACM46_11145 [Chryseobacterium angstadtii]